MSDRPPSVRDESGAHPASTGDPAPMATTRTDAPRPKPPATRRLLPWVAGVALLTVAAGGVLLSQGPEEGPAPADQDVPHTEGRTVVLPPKFQQRLELKFTVVREQPLVPVAKVAGIVAFDPKFVAAVGTRLRGLIRKVSAFEGDVVKEGAVLAEIDSPELGSAQANVLALRAQAKAAQLNSKREQDLAGRGLTTAREVEEAAADQEDYRSRLLAAEQQVSALGGARVAADYTGAVGIHQLRSPLAGTVVERNVSAGQSVEGHLTAFRVADLDHLWVELAVFERNLGALRKGDQVDLQPLASPRDALVGQVAHIGDQIDLATRTAVVRVEVDNRARKLRPGQAVTARVHLSGDNTTAVKVVPNSAVTYVDGKPTVFVAETELRLVATEVELGESDGNEQEITKGLVAGQHVVSGGVFALKSELFR